MIAKIIVVAITVMTIIFSIGLIIVISLAKEAGEAPILGFVGGLCLIGTVISGLSGSVASIFIIISKKKMRISL